MTSRYHEVYENWRRDPEGFWAEAAREIDWFSSWGKVFDAEAGVYGRWFAGATCNTCYNALDRHVQSGRAEQTALIHDSAIRGRKQSFTYAEMLKEVTALAAVLQDQGVAKGDRVIIYMPMVPEAVISMLGCARIGAIHSVVFGGFAPQELAIRIDDAQPKVVVSASCGIEVTRVVEYKPLLDRAIEMATHKPQNCVILQRPMATASLVAGRDVEWNAALAGAQPHPCVPVEATDPLYVLYTSGTTARPKGVVRDNGGHAVALRWSLPHIYDTHPGDVFWAASDVGWVVGHSYIVYGPLLTGCTTILFEGKPVGTPDPGVFWRVIAQHGVKALFTAPTAFRAIKKEDPKGAHLAGHDLSKFEYLFLAGERLDPDTYHWARDLLQVPVIDHWWQTETGWPVAANCMGLDVQPVKPGSPTKPVPGYDVRILNDAGAEAGAGEEGAVVIRLPLPPGTLPTLWHDDDRFLSSYMERFPGYYMTGDGGFVDEDGYLFVMGRIDDVINVAGHRLSTGAMEEVIATHPDVAECAVIGVADELKGQVPIGFAVLKAGSGRDNNEIERELIAMVRDRIGAVAAFRRALVVPRLPKTRSGKILRATMRKIADAEPYDVPSTIDDPMILDEIGDVLAQSSTT